VRVSNKEERDPESKQEQQERKREKEKGRVLVYLYSLEQKSGALNFTAIHLKPKQSPLELVWLTNLCKFMKHLN